MLQETGERLLLPIKKHTSSKWTTTSVNNTDSCAAIGGPLGGGVGAGVVAFRSAPFLSVVAVVFLVPDDDDDDDDDAVGAGAEACERCVLTFPSCTYPMLISSCPRLLISCSLP